MKTLAFLATILCASGAFGQLTYTPKAVLMVDVSGNPFPSGSGAPLSYTPQAMACYTNTTGQVLPCVFTGGSGGDTITSPNGTLTVGGTATATTLDINLAKSLVWTASGALSAPAVLYNGLPVITGGTGTTTWPLVLIQPNGTTTTTWSTVGTMFGVNAASGFAGNLFDFQANGTSDLSLSNGGTLNGTTAKFKTYNTPNTCGSAASPAVCGGNAAGAVVIAATTTSVVVDTSVVTANSQILIQDDSSLSTKLSVTCNTTLAPPQVTARTAGTSFTISTAVAPTANPACYSYTIIN